VEAIAEIEQAAIDTDISIMPYTDIVTEFVNYIPDLMIVRNLQVTGDYVSVQFSKSSRTTTYSRSFNKLDNYFSYIGGLLGSALGIFFLLNYYSEQSYLVDIGSLILSDDNA
jgi:hypothetical protein